MKSITQLINNFRKLAALLRRFDIKLTPIFWAAVLACLASLAEGVTMALMVPTIKGLLQENFTAVLDLPFLMSTLKSLGLAAALSAHASMLYGLLLGTLFVAVLLKNYFYVLSAFQITRINGTFTNRLRQTIYSRFLGFGKLFFDQSNSGHLQSLLINHPSLIAKQLENIPNVIYAVFTLLVYFGIMFRISFGFTVFVFLVFPTLHYSLSWLIKRIERTSKSYVEAFSKLNLKLSNALSCISLIKACSTEDREKEWFGYTSDRIEGLAFSIQKKHLLIAPSQEIILTFLLILLIVAILIVKAQNPATNISNYLVFLFLIRRSVTLFGTFNVLRGGVATIRGTLDQIAEVFSEDGKPYVQEGARIFNHLTDRIEIRNLSFAFPSGSNALKSINLKVEKGKSIALVGPSGAGKSTLVSLLMRLYECPPKTIFFDGTDIREYTMKSLHSRMAWVSQDANLLNSSLRVNLSYGIGREASDAELFQIMEKASLTRFLKQLPQGLDTEIGDRGVRLSGGERQRVCIARAMLKDPDIWLLDEATSALDSETERAIQATFDQFRVNRTTIVIAHRLSTVRNVDRVLVLKDGTISEEGEFSKLQSGGGTFQKLWEGQLF